MSGPITTASLFPGFGKSTMSSWSYRPRSTRRAGRPIAPAANCSTAKSTAASWWSARQRRSATQPACYSPRGSIRLRIAHASKRVARCPPRQHSHRRPSPDWIFRAITGDAALKPFDNLFGDPSASTAMPEGELRHVLRRAQRLAQHGRHPPGVAGIRARAADQAELAREIAEALQARDVVRAQALTRACHKRPSLRSLDSRV